jgi:hypothetical protein
MFEWQYELQKRLQNPKIVKYSDADPGNIKQNIYKPPTMQKLMTISFPSHSLVQTPAKLPYHHIDYHIRAIQAGYIQ